MTTFEEDRSNETGAPADSPSAEPLPSFALSDPSALAPSGSSSTVPEDLRISWSWPHFVVFILFSAGSLLIVQFGFITYLTSYRRLSIKDVERVLTTQAPLVVAMQIVWFALILLFLYMTLGVLRDAPFWRSLGWRGFAAGSPAGRSYGWRYFFSGCGLAIFVAAAGYGIHPKEKLPIQELFKDRNGTLLLMSLAVLVAPLVEETLFRGYLYPLFARKLGVPAGILITGFLFGLMHGAQLGWTKELVALLTLVGLIFTYVRARTGTVLASYLLHLGYNSMIAFSVILATRGFQQFPVGK